MKTHLIDIDTEYFDLVLDGTKTFDVRKNDRGYQLGDILLMKEVGDAGEDRHWVTYDPDCSRCRSVRYISANISYVYSGDPRFSTRDDFGGLQPGTVVLGLVNVKEIDQKTYQRLGRR